MAFFFVVRRNEAGNIRMT